MAPHPAPSFLFVSALLAAAASAAAQDPVDRPFPVGGATVRIDRDAAGAAVVRGGAVSRLPATDGLLHLRAGTFDPLRAAPTFAGALAAPVGGRLFCVQFHTAIVPEYRAALLAAGFEVLAYWPSSAYVVRGDRAAVAALQREPWVRWVGDVAPGHKFDAKLARVVGVAGERAFGSREYALVLAHKDDRGGLLAAIAAEGGKVTKANVGSVYLLAELSSAQLLRMAARDDVLWIEPASAVEHDLNNARIQGGANAVEFGGGLTGQGLRVQILEGLDETHPDWTLAPLVQYDDDVDAHGHCTAMIVAGSGTGNTNARGIVPDAQVIESAVSAWGMLSRWQVTQAARDPGLPWQVLQQTASWGFATTTQYDAASAELDDVLFAFDLVATQSQSNTGTTASRPQAWAKNVISVGGVFHRDNANPLDDAWRIVGQSTPASIGPAADGRIKPDVVGYYDAIQCGDLPGAAGYSATNYTNAFGGTSGATPMVNGFVGLLQQMFTDGAFGNALPAPALAANRFVNRPHAATIKALLCNTAASYAFSGAGHDLARTHQGWGFPDVARAWQQRARTVVADEYDVLQQGDVRTYYVWIRPGTAEFRATMAHADPAALPSALVHRVNSLDLQVTRLADGLAWWGNHGLDVGNVSVPGGSANDRDTLEQVWLANPPAGLYAVSVSAPTIVQDAHLETAATDADFALCMHPVGGGYRATSTIDLDLVAAAPGDLQLQLSSVPATGWSEGFTLVSFDTSRPLGFGAYFGVEGDAVTAAVLTQPAAVGDAFHFVNAGAGQFPFVPYVVPPALANGLHGLTLDAVTVFLTASGEVFEVTDVDRVTVR